MKKQISFLLTFVILLLLIPAFAEAFPTTVWKCTDCNYTVQQVSHGRLNCSFHVTKSNVTHCVIQTGNGIVSVELSDQNSVSWSSANHTLRVNLLNDSKYFSFSYTPPLLVFLTQNSMEYDDTLIFSFLDSSGTILSTDTMFISGKASWISIQMEQ